MKYFLLSTILATGINAQASIYYKHLRKAILMDFTTFECGPKHKQEKIDSLTIKCKDLKNNEYTLFKGNKEGFIVEATHYQEYDKKCSKESLAEVFKIKEYISNADGEFYFYPDDVEVSVGQDSGYSNLKLSCKENTNEYYEVVKGKIESNLPVNPKGKSLDSISFLSDFKNLKFGDSFNDVYNKKSCKKNLISVNGNNQEKAIYYYCEKNKKPYQVMVVFSKDLLEKILITFPFNKEESLSMFSSELDKYTIVKSLVDIPRKDGFFTYKTSESDATKKQLQTKTVFYDKKDLNTEVIKKLKRDIRVAFLNETILERVNKNPSDYDGAYFWRIDENNSEGNMIILDNLKAIITISKIKPKKPLD